MEWHEVDSWSTEVYGTFYFTYQIPVPKTNVICNIIWIIHTTDEAKGAQLLKTQQPNFGCN
jgi:hypothetical protein